MGPDFILGGVQKSGTTLLHNILFNHPQIAMLDRNMQYAYFDNDRVFTRGMDWYLKLFSSLESAKNTGSIIGQTSADCAFNSQAVKRIMEVLPNIKLIFVLRHPIDRAYSLYWHQYSMAREHYRFEKAIRIEPNRIRKSDYNLRQFSYMERSRYKKQFDRILGLVPQKNIILLPFDALTTQPLSTVNRIFDFLEVATISNLEELKFSTLPRNSARIPSNHTVAVVAAYIKKLGLTSIGRRLLNMFRVEQRPPKMSIAMSQLLQSELAEDIAFFETMKSEFIASLND